MADQLNDHRLGWLGTGRMGQSLSAACWPPAVTSRSTTGPRPRRSRSASSAKVVDSASDLASCDIVFTCVGTPQDLTDAVLGQGGLMAATAMPSVLVDCSTVSAEVSAHIRERLAAAAPLCSPRR